MSVCLWILLIVLVVFIKWIIEWGARVQFLNSGTPRGGEAGKKVKKSICNTNYNSDAISLEDMTHPLHVQNYITACGSPPPFYIPKEKAKKAGWVTKKKKNNLQAVLPKRVIGYDIYKNRNGQLPQAKYREFDINYSGHLRGTHCLIVNEKCFAKSNIKKCEIFSTSDHYKTLTKLI